MKKIVWITPRFFVETDIYAIKLLSGNYEIHWFIIENKECQEYSDLIDILNSNKNVDVKKIMLPAHNRSLRCLKFYYKFLIKVKNMTPDVVYSPIFGMPYYMPLLATILDRKKTVVAVHNVTTPKGSKAPSYLSKLYTYFVTHTFKNYHTLSPSQCDILREIAPQAKVFYIPFVLKDYGNSTVAKSDILTFLFFGQILEYKRVDVLIEAAQRVFEKTKIPFKVKIAGKCSFWEKYQSLIKYNDLFDITIRRIHNEEIPNLFVSSHYFVMPYQDIAQSGALMVAINYNLPVIASQIPAFTEYIENERNGYLIEPASVEGFSQVLFKIVNGNGVDYNVLQKCMQKQKERYFEDNAICNGYKAMFSKIVFNDA